MIIWSMEYLYEGGHSWTHKRIFFVYVVRVQCIWFSYIKSDIRTEVLQSIKLSTDTWFFSIHFMREVMQHNILITLKSIDVYRCNIFLKSFPVQVNDHESLRRPIDFHHTMYRRWRVQFYDKSDFIIVYDDYTTGSI